MFFLCLLALNSASFKHSLCISITPPPFPTLHSSLDIYGFLFTCLSRLFRLTTPGSSLHLSCLCESEQSSFVTLAQTNKGGDACFLKMCRLDNPSWFTVDHFFSSKRLVLRDRENNLITRLTFNCQKGSKKCYMPS